MIFLKNSYIQSDLKASNRKSTYDFLSKSHMISRAELSRELGISGATMLKIIDFFLERGVCLVDDIGYEYTSVGRKPVMLRFNPNFAHIISIYIEGNYISIALVNMSGEICAIREFRVLNVWNFLFNGLGVVFNSLFAEVKGCKPMGIGIALPAVINSKTNEIIEAPLLGQADSTSFANFLKQLEDSYHLPVCIQNDVNASAYGEFINNYNCSIESMLYVSIGTGVGGGIILNSKLVKGENNSAGEIGYMILGDDFEYGKESGGWLENKINLAAVTKMLETGNTSGIDLSIRDQVIDYIAYKLSLCITNIATVLDISTIVIGGIVAEDFGEPLLNAIREKCSKQHYQKRRIEACKTYKAGVVGLSYLAAQPVLENLMAE